jgi:hypothetical protein
LCRSTREEEVIVDRLPPIVGSWRVAVSVGSVTGLTNLATLSADGTMVVAFPSPRPAPPGAAIGTHTVRATVEVSSDGWQDPFTIEIAADDGTVQATFSGTVTAPRIPAGNQLRAES